MEAQITNSSKLTHLAWDNNILTATFPTGAVYDYFGVPEEHYHAIIAAESPGQTFGALIQKGGYEYNKKGA